MVHLDRQGVLVNYRSSVIAIAGASPVFPPRGHARPNSTYVPLPTSTLLGFDIQTLQHPRLSSARIRLKENILIIPLLGETSQIYLFPATASERAIITTSMAH